MKLQRVGLATILGLAVAGAASALTLVQYYRWASAPVTTCSTDQDGHSLHFANQPREWANLSSAARVQTHFLTDGVDSTTPLFDPPDGTGSQTYSGFGSDEAPYPFHYTMRLDTFGSSSLTYQSALTATCTGDGTATAVEIGWLPGAASINYRWAYAPAVECSTKVSGVSLRLAEEPQKWENLPAAAEYDIVSSTNGVEAASGANPLPSGDGSVVFGSLIVFNPAYPLHYALRLDTKLNGSTLFHSVVVAACEADGPGTSRLYNVPEPAAASLAFAAFVALAAIAARSSRAA